MINIIQNFISRVSFFSIIIFLLTINVYADDSDAAQQYVQWIQQAMNEDRWTDAKAAALRAWDFANVSSDIPYLLAVIQSHFGEERNRIVAVLDVAIEVNRWVAYNENHALLLKAEKLIALRNYESALNCLEQLPAIDAAGDAAIRTETIMLYLLALKGMALDPINTNELVQFRRQVLLAMDRYPRDPRPLRIFFSYASNHAVSSRVGAADINMLELALRRLPFLLEIDPELSYIAAPFVHDIEDARRLVASYRSVHVKPNPASIPVALNLGLINDNTAIDELFQDNENSEINKDILLDVYRLLRSEEGREYFTHKLHSFSGLIFKDEDNDGYIDTRVVYNSGNIQSLVYDRIQNNVFDFKVNFSAEGAPVTASIPASITWERYPSVKQAVLSNETFTFAPAYFNYAPVSFVEIGGSNNISGLSYPELMFHNIEITRHTLLSFCSSITRPSLEIEGAIETIYMDRGVILQAVETLNGQQVSVTEFERGLPAVQYIDLDLDGRMETIRRFRRPYHDYVWESLLDYRRLIASSESDWLGNGLYKTMEVYLPDGSIVYLYDMDGSGEMNYLETNN